MLDDDAVFLPTLGFYFWATSGVTFTPPTDIQIKNFDAEDPNAFATATGMHHLGHTDLDEDEEGDEEGGDSEVRGTRQRPNLRERVEPVVRYTTINLVQFTPASLDLYYGPGSTVTDGRYTTPASRRATEGAFLSVYCDGTRNIGRYWPKTSARSGGPMGAEAENFLRLPIRFTPLSTEGGGEIWISDDLFTVETP